MEADNPSVSGGGGSRVHLHPCRIARPPALIGDLVFYVRRGILLGVGILCIALLGSGRSIGERLAT